MRAGLLHFLQALLLDHERLFFLSQFLLENPHLRRKTFEFLRALSCPPQDSSSSNRSQHGDANQSRKCGDTHPQLHGSQFYLSGFAGFTDQDESVARLGAYSRFRDRGEISIGGTIFLR